VLDREAVGVKQQLRRFTERAARRTQFRRRLPREFAERPIWVSPDARLRFLKWGCAAFDAELLAYAIRYVNPGDTVWDVGCNVGEFTITSAHRTGRQGAVLALDADREMITLLQRSIREGQNRDLNISAICSAVSDREGTAELRIARRGRAANALVNVNASSQMGGTRKVVTVSSVTLDGLLNTYPAPDLVKIDVEGAEFLLLSAATRLLRELRPKIIVEVSDNAIEIFNLLKGAGYRIYDAALGNQSNEIAECAFNTLAIPG